MRTQTHRSSLGEGLLNFAIALVLLVVVIGGSTMVLWKYGLIDLPTGKITIQGQTEPPPGANTYRGNGGNTTTTDNEPVVAPTPNLYPEPPQGMSAPPPVEYQPPMEAAPAGAPMTEEYREVIQSQDRTNDQGQVCAPRSGCTTPGDGGPLPWPNGRP